LLMLESTRNQRSYTKFVYHYILYDYNAEYEGLLAAGLRVPFDKSESILKAIINLFYLEHLVHKVQDKIFLRIQDTYYG
jgi:hypothetical protein